MEMVPFSFSSGIITERRRSWKNQQFVWLKSKILALDSIAELTFDRISIDLTTFQKDILRKYKHPKVNKQQVDALEVFVSSGTEEPTYYDQLLSNLSSVTVQSLLKTMKARKWKKFQESL